MSTRSPDEGVVEVASETEATAVAAPLTDTEAAHLRAHLERAERDYEAWQKGGPDWSPRLIGESQRSDFDLGTVARPLLGRLLDERADLASALAIVKEERSKWFVEAVGREAAHAAEVAAHAETRAALDAMTLDRNHLYDRMEAAWKEVGDILARREKNTAYAINEGLRAEAAEQARDAAVAERDEWKARYADLERSDEKGWNEGRKYAVTACECAPATPPRDPFRGDDWSHAQIDGPPVAEATREPFFMKIVDDVVCCTRCTRPLHEHREGEDYEGRFYICEYRAPVAEEAPAPPRDEPLILPRQRWQHVTTGDWYDIVSVDGDKHTARWPDGTIVRDLGNDLLRTYWKLACACVGQMSGGTHAPLECSGNGWLVGVPMWRWPAAPPPTPPRDEPCKLCGKATSRHAGPKGEPLYCDDVRAPDEPRPRPPDDKRLPPLDEATPIGSCAADAAATHRCLDERGVPRHSPSEMTFSLWGRVIRFAVNLTDAQREAMRADYLSPEERAAPAASPMAHDAHAKSCASNVAEGGYNLPCDCRPAEALTKGPPRSIASAPTIAEEAHDDQWPEPAGERCYTCLARRAAAAQAPTPGVEALMRLTAEAKDLGQDVKVYRSIFHPERVCVAIGPNVGEGDTVAEACSNLVRWTDHCRDVRERAADERKDGR